MTVTLILAIFVAAVSCTSDILAEDVSVSWTIDPRTNSYQNQQTKIMFEPSVAGFKLDRPSPAEEDGGASFGYSGPTGIITLYLQHRGISDCLPEGDCASRFLASRRDELKRQYGKFDSERSFTLVGECGGQAVRGAGTTYHFLRFPDAGGTSVYTEAGAVQVGDFIYYYRGTFPTENGLLDLALFLRALGLRKI